MKRGLWVFLVLLIYGGTALGQGIESCNQCVCVADNTCTTEPGGCGDDPGCGGVSFTAACGADYTVKVVITCSSGDVCEFCYGCAHLSHDGEVIVGSIAQTGCSPDACEGTAGGVQLAYNEEYKLYACLRKCSGDCETCESCTVRAYVYRFWSDCLIIPGCNP